MRFFAETEASLLWIDIVFPLAFSKIITRPSFSFCGEELIPRTAKLPGAVMRKNVFAKGWILSLFPAVSTNDPTGSFN
jgi:hypothetical protein